MTYVDIFGWMAAGLTLSAFAMKTMLPFRLVAISANVSFIAYGYVADLQAVLTLHLILLPFNLFRLIQLMKTASDVSKAAAADAPPDSILSYLTPIEVQDDQVIFNKGDRADYIYYIQSGEVFLEEIGRTLPAGEIFGEIAFFGETKKRTLSAKCVGACKIYAISEKHFTRVFFQSPEFSIYILKLMAQRMEKNLS